MNELWQYSGNLSPYEVRMRMSRSEIVEKLERSGSAITRQALRIDIPLIRKMTGRPWTVVELHLFGRFSEGEIARAAGRAIYSVRNERDALARSEGLTTREWSTGELATLMRYVNAEVLEITGRNIEGVRDKWLQVSIERNGWDARNPERKGS